MIVISAESEKSIKTYIKNITKLLSTYRWILDAYVSDFFFRDHWTKLPSSWQGAFESMTTDELSCLLDRDGIQSRHVLPLSLLSFHQCTQTFAIDRSVCSDFEPSIAKLFPYDSSRKPHMRTTIDILAQGATSELHSYFRKHVKPKKQHEILNLAKVLGAMCDYIPCDTVVDVGAGLGHLSRLLTFGYHLCTISVEAAGTHAPKATKYDQEIKAQLLKKQLRGSNKDPKEPIKSTFPCHVTNMIQPNMTTQDFLAIIQQQNNMDHPTDHEDNCLPDNKHIWGPTAGKDKETLKRHSKDGEACIEAKIMKSNLLSGELTKNEKTIDCRCLGNSMSSAYERDVVRDLNKAKMHKRKNATPLCGNAEGCFPSCVKCSMSNQGIEMKETLKIEYENNSPNQHSDHLEDGELMTREELRPVNMTTNLQEHVTLTEVVLDKEAKSHVDKNIIESKHTDEQKIKKVNACNSEDMFDEREGLKINVSEEHAKLHISKSNLSKFDCNALNDEIRLSVPNKHFEDSTNSEHTLESEVIGNRKQMHQIDKEIQRKDRQNVDLASPECICPCLPTSTSSPYSQQSGETYLQSADNTMYSDQLRFVLTGLHACGDLTPTFLRFFVNCTAAQGLASVGCCYMKMSEKGSNVEVPGYPMSQFVANLPEHYLSFNSRELACHFADTYLERLKTGSAHLKIHSYRAALEWIANQISPTFQRSAVQIPARKTNQMDFPQYARLGLEKLGLSTDLLTEELLQCGLEMTARWKDVVAFYTVRLSLAPVIETLILLDRAIYLLENGYTCALVPIFDPTLSPRNFALLSWKSS